MNLDDWDWMTTAGSLFVRNVSQKVPQESFTKFLFLSFPYARLILPSSISFNPQGSSYLALHYQLSNFGIEVRVYANGIYDFIDNRFPDWTGHMEPAVLCNFVIRDTDWSQ